MRAYLLTGYGAVADNVRLAEIAEPRAAAGEVVIDIHAASLNPIDFKLVHGALKRISKYRSRQPVFRDPLQRAMHELEVDRIEAGGVNVDHDLARRSARLGNLRKPDIVGDGAVAGEEVGAHRWIPRRSKRSGPQERTRTAKITLFRAGCVCPALD